MIDSTGNIVDLDEYRQHIVLTDIHGAPIVAPTALYEKIVSGDTKIQDIDDWELMMRSIIKDWLSML